MITRIATTYTYPEKKFTNIVGTIHISEINFMPEDKPKIINPTYFLIKSGLRNGTYVHYIYATGESTATPNCDVLMCYDIFNQWRHSCNENSFLNNEVIQIEF